MKIITVLGARPQFIKAAVVSRAIADYNKNNGDTIVEKIVHTGQHFDKNMSDDFFTQMDIPQPAFHLAVSNLPHGAMTGRMLEEVEKILLQENPDFVMVYGDTNSTLAGALAARKLHIRLAHVEAGLRSFNMDMPEEVNRILTDRISDLLFCPTQTAVANLKNESFEKFKARIVMSGDVMFDAALYYRNIAQPGVEIESLGKQGQFILATLHRAENTDDPVRLSSIIQAMEYLAQTQTVILPLHPRTKMKLSEHGIKYNNITVIDPVGYFDMIFLLSNCSFVMTDSGGVQKEAFFFEKPCITLRDETEWVELVENGYNRLTGADYDSIIRAAKDTGRQLDYKLPLYGTGKAGEKIVQELLNN